MAAHPDRKLSRPPGKQGVSNIRDVPNKPPGGKISGNTGASRSEIGYSHVHVRDFFDSFLTRQHHEQRRRR